MLFTWPALYSLKFNTVSLSPVDSQHRGDTNVLYLVLCVIYAVSEIKPGLDLWPSFESESLNVLQSSTLQKVPKLQTFISDSGYSKNNNGGIFRIAVYNLDYNRAKTSKCSNELGLA